MISFLKILIFFWKCFENIGILEYFENLEFFVNNCNFLKSIWIMEAEEQRRQMSQVEGEGENEASLSLPCGRQK